MSVEPSWRLAVALVLLVALGVVASRVARFGIGRQVVVASVRAVAQLAVVSLVIVAAIAHVWSSLLFVVLMFVVGTVTTCRRTGIRRAWPWVAAAMAAGALPVLAVVFGLGVAPFVGVSIIPLAGIIIGNMMSAHTLTGRRLFPALREGLGTYDAALSIGLPRSEAIAMVTGSRVVEALVPTIDSTRTVGLVTLPGAFVGVLLGGGSPLQAGAAQVLVLVGILVGQVLTVASAHAFVRRARLLPGDLADRLRP